MTSCKNCNTQLLSENHYCTNCGGKVIRNRLTLKTLFTNFSEQFLNYDNKFLKTFIHLFTKPEIVIDGYISGTRKKYVNVISYFAIALTLTGLQIFIIQKFFPESIDFSSMTSSGNEEFMQKWMDSVLEYQSLFMMFNIPIYAIISKLTFLNKKKYNYTEHLIINIYLTAQLSIIGVFLVLAGVIFGQEYGMMSYANFGIMVLYYIYTLRRMYSLSIKKVILKIFLFISIMIAFLIIAIILFLIGMAIFTYINPEGIKEFMETQKSMQQN